MKSSAWIFTIIGVLLVLPLLGVTALNTLAAWVIPFAGLLMGIIKLMRNYQAKRRR